MQKFKFELQNQNPIRVTKSKQRVLIKKNTIKQNMNSLKGIIIAILGKSFFVELIESMELIDATLSGSVVSAHNHKNIAVVGDFVEIIVDNKHRSEIDLPTGMIIKIGKRKSYFSRKAAGKSTKEHILAANADMLGIVVSVFNPEYNRKLIDRMLIAAELGMLEPIIIMNKIDQIDDKKLLEEDFEIYKKLGINICYISCNNNLGIEELLKIFENKTIILSGQSGVGKSSLINTIIGDVVQVVNIVSERTTKGQHTTSFVKMFKIDNGVKIIDTPGIREFGLFGIDKYELCYYFKEFEEFYLKCKYLPCTHTHEPECEVLNALENGLIEYERYESYINILDSIS